MANSRMSFNEQDEFGDLRVRSGSSGITGFLIRNSGGLIKNERQASAVMIVLIVVCVVLAFVLKPEGGQTEKSQGLQAPPGKTIEYPESGPPRISQ